MQTIWRFTMTDWDTTIVIPSRSKILHFGVRGDEATIWALVNPDRVAVSRRFVIVGTGTAQDVSTFQYIGTIQFPYAWHLFERPVFEE